MALIRKVVLLDESTVEAINEYRFENRHKTEMDAIRDLLNKGLVHLKVAALANVSHQSETQIKLG